MPLQTKDRACATRWFNPQLAAAMAILLLCGTAVPAAAGVQRPGRYAGRLVGEVLRELQRQGAPIIFSSTLVGADLRVKVEPRRTEKLRQLAEDILAPHGLAIADGPRNSWLVVRAPKAEKPESSRGVRPPPAESDSVQRQDPLRIEERVNVSDRAGDLARSPSAYAVDVERTTETAGGLENPFQALPGLPGVAATNDHDGKLAVRGAGPEHNTVVFDGVQVYSPQRMASDLGGQQSFVNPATIGSLALDASGLDARYGGRLSSATVLETRNGTASRRLALSGSAGLTSGDLLAEGRLPGTLSGSWWATLRGTYYRLVADRFKDGDIPSFVDFQFKIAIKPTPRTSLSVLGLTGAEAMVRPRQGPPDQQQNFAGENLREFHADTRLALANFHWTPGPRVSTTTTINAYTNASRSQDAWIDWQTGEPFDRRVTMIDVAGRQRASIAWSPRHVLDIGGEVHRVRSSWAMKGLDLLPRRTVGPDVWGNFVEYDGPIDARLMRTQVGAWAQQRVPIPAGVILEPGLRVDWNTLTRETAVQPRLRLTRPLGRSSVVWAGVGWQAQTPAYETMQHGLPYYELVGPDASDLRNERLRQVVVGTDWQFGPSMTLRIEAYHRTLDRLLVQRLESDREREQRLAGYEIPPDMPAGSAILEHRPTADPESVGRGRATGLEILLDRSRGRVSGWVSYTLAKADRQVFGRTVPFDFDRRHAISLAVNVAVTSKLRASVRSQHASGFPVTPVHEEVAFNDYRNVSPGPPPGSLFKAGRARDGRLLSGPDLYSTPRLSLLNSARLSAYSRTDIRFTYVIDRRVEAYGEVINFFDRENFRALLSDATAAGRGPVEYQHSPAFPRLFTYGVRFKF